MRALVVLALAQAVFCASVFERAKQCGGRICTADYSPVCGTDGHTYSNTCHLGIATCNDPSVTLAHNGPCGVHVIPQHCQIMCIDLWDPVCGSDGKTYGNDCNLKAAQCVDSSITLAHKGSCGGGAIIV